MGVLAEIVKRKLGLKTTEIFYLNKGDNCNALLATMTYKGQVRGGLDQFSFMINTDCGMFGDPEAEAACIETHYTQKIKPGGNKRTVRIELLLSGKRVKPSRGLYDLTYGANQDGLIVVSKNEKISITFL